MSPHVAVSLGVNTIQLTFQGGLVVMLLLMGFRLPS